MADVLSSNLYPPIVDSFMPAFTGNSCNIYFELSDFNTVSDIDPNLVQVSVRSQRSNENALINENGIRYYELEGPVTETGDPNKGKYYITIEASHLAEGIFYKNQYYKVQIRFTKSNSVTGTSYYRNTTDNPSITWINSNLNLFSEWSTVCLIRQITEPTLATDNRQVNPKEEVGGWLSNSPYFKFIQAIDFNKNEDEYLQSYRLILTWDEIIDGETIERTIDSGIVYPPVDNRTDIISYNFKTRLKQNISYTVTLHITSNNLYTKTFTFENVRITNTSVNLATPTLTVITDIDNGRNKIEVTIGENEQINLDNIEYISIYRASNKTNFEIWDEIALVSFNKLLNVSNVFFDYSIESGVWYKYAVQFYGNNISTYSNTVTKEEPVINLFEDVFLNSKGRQLRMQFDSHITSYKRVSLESKIETLGSKFPVVRRNSATNYKSFAITGIISFLSDENEIFLTEDEIYGGSSTITEKYHSYNSENRIHPYNDYIKEREFREKVMDYLTSGEVFLLRTMTEGNVLVRLMEINFTPNQSLNNYICTFTANAVEIAECSPENYYKYKVFPYLYTTLQLEE